jgi:hypothetical protein
MTRSGTTLTLAQSLVQTAPNFSRYDFFGNATAVEGDTLFTTAAAFGVDIESSLALQTSVGHGRAYFGTRGPSGWTLPTRIDVPFVPGGGITPYDYMGGQNSVALQGDMAVSATTFQPRARVYRRTSGVWAEAYQLDPTPEMGTNHAFSTVAMDAGTIVIGGVAGNEVYPPTNFEGAVAIFVLPQ